MRRMVIALMLALAATNVARGQRQEPPVTRAQLNGEWTGTLALDNSSPRISAVFALSDSAFAGKVYADNDPMGDMEGGSLDGSKVHFKVGRYDFTGTITGSTMRVELIVYNGSTRTFTMRKTPSEPGDSPRRRPD